MLTALSNGFSRKSVMLATAVIFSLGSLMTALFSELALMNLVRFAAGLGHGLFLAVESSTAARLVGKARAATAVAIVFSGFTLAMAFGVPLSTYFFGGGGVMNWRWVLMVIAFFGFLGFVGLLFGMKDPLKTEQPVHPLSSIKILFDKALLKAASVTLFAYAGAFATYTYIAPFIAQITGEENSMVGVYMLLFGIFAAIGNLADGKLTDRFDIRRANIVLISMLALSSLLISWLGGSPILMKILVAVLGFFTFAIVPSLQAFLLQTAHQHNTSDSVAAGLNIAGFNLAIAFGSFAGSLVINHFGLAYVGTAGAVLSFIGLGVFVWLGRKG
ncbi:MFS transporter [Neisseria sicca]|nr:MFS transporter [Neisseria sicca]